MTDRITTFDIERNGLPKGEAIISPNGHFVLQLLNAPGHPADGHLRLISMRGGSTDGGITHTDQPIPVNDFGGDPRVKTFGVTTVSGSHIMALLPANISTDVIVDVTGPLDSTGLSPLPITFIVILNDEGDLGVFDNLGNKLWPRNIIK